MTIWMERTAGESAPIGTPTVDPLPEEPTALLIHGGVPDWIRNPITGAQARVEGTETFKGPCPNCGAPVQGLALKAEHHQGPDRQLLVIECPTEGKYVFCDRPRVAPTG